MLITTTDILQGIEIKEYIGIVYGFSFDANAGLGKVGSKLMDLTMSQLIGSLQVSGENVGVDAIIGLRIAYEKGYVRCVGTAVKYR